MQNFCLLIADGVGLKRNRRLHRGEADELHDVVRHHVAQRAGIIVVTAALLNANSLRHGDLYVIDVTAVPDRLEDSVRKAECQDVLNGFFAEIVVDAVDLFLAGYAQELLIEGLGGFQVVPEWLFNNDATPVLAIFLHQPGC